MSVILTRGCYVFNPFLKNHVGIGILGLFDTRRGYNKWGSIRRVIDAYGGASMKS